MTKAWNELNSPKPPIEDNIRLTNEHHRKVDYLMANWRELSPNHLDWLTTFAKRVRSQFSVYPKTEKFINELVEHCDHNAKVKKKKAYEEDLFRRAVLDPESMTPEDMAKVQELREGDQWATRELERDIP